MYNNLYYMKKLFMVAIILMVGVSVAMAQKDVKAVGLNLNYGSEIKNVGIGAKFQYGITDAVRGEASFNYYLEKDGLSMWDLNANIHYLIDVAEKIKVYPLAGIGYANFKSSWGFEYDEEYDYGDYYSLKSRNGWDYDEEDMEGGSVNSGEIVVNLGVGAEYQLNEKLSIGAELKYQIIDNFNQIVLGVGVTYKF